MRGERSLTKNRIILLSVIFILFYFTYVFIYFILVRILIFSRVFLIKNVNSE